MNTEELVKRYVLNKKIKEYFKKNPSKNNVVIKTESNGQKVYWKVIREDKKFVVTEVVANKTKFVFEGALQNQMDNVDKKDRDVNIASNVELEDFEPASEKETPITSLTKDEKYQLTRPEFKLTVKENLKKIKAMLNEASPAFAQISKDYMNAVTHSPDHNTLSQTLKTINSLLPQLHDPKEREQAGQMVGTLTPMIDKSTAHGSGGLPQMQKPVTKPAQQPAAPKKLQVAGKTNKGKKVEEASKKKL